MPLKKSDMPVIIQAIRDPNQWQDLSPSSPCWVFILGGTIDSVAESVARLQRWGCKVFVHVDMVKGLNGDFEGIRFFQEFAAPDGIITTHPYTITHAKKLGLAAIQRIFLLDSQSVESGIQQIAHVDADAVEVLPGLLPVLIRYLCQRIAKPLIAGGLITTTEHVAGALNAGAISVSTSSQRLWHQSWDRASLTASHQSNQYQEG